MKLCFELLPPTDGNPDTLAGDEKLFVPNPPDLMLLFPLPKPSSSPVPNELIIGPELFV